METCDLGTITITGKATPVRSSSVSLPEAVAWFAGERHSHRPRCLSPVLLATSSVLSERLAHAKRQRLKQFVPGLAATSGDGLDRQRSLLAMDWLVRVHTPAWLRLVPSLNLAAACLAEGAPVLRVAEAAELIEAPLAAVRRASWGPWTSAPWHDHGISGADVSAAVSRALSALAADAAVAATLDIAGTFLPACGRMRLAIEQAVLIAACSHPWSSDSTTLDDHIAAVVAPTAHLLEDAVIELFSRLVDATPPADEGWLATHPADAARSAGPV
ncbi:hypothetical protein [Saccharomonospora xinjiangensis]|uniref:Uncharacterized protein n=1 Tax=Saccharomonospora xinjiangensis XJ-54 TaxID=882086 RepID=I0V5U6_9PSEU|nr:hypothetical protein [Saccharomonospora xinjiangensis]EID55499.1 hypothetical protein SacxiDRAFT_3294 [Saccharomonospora xinjiangensis XJ-54]